MVHVTFPVGATELAFPVTVAVKVRVAARVLPPAEATEMVGVAGATTVVVAEAATETGRYPLSPGNVKFAPYVPANEATTVQWYVETLLVALGPSVVAQVVTPATPEIVQIPEAVGGFASGGPVTVAVKPRVEPSGPVGASAETDTIGKVLATVVVPPEVKAEGK